MCPAYLSAMPDQMRPNADGDWLAMEDMEKRKAIQGRKEERLEYRRQGEE